MSGNYANKRRKLVITANVSHYRVGPTKIPMMSPMQPMAVGSSLVVLRNTVCVLAFFLICGLTSAQTPKQASCVVEDIDTPTMPACVIQSRNGVLFVPKKYWMHPAFNRYGLSAFTI